jgi:hypothetical protein
VNDLLELLTGKPSLHSFDRPHYSSYIDLDLRHYGMISDQVLAGLLHKLTSLSVAAQVAACKRSVSACSEDDATSVRLGADVMRTAFFMSLQEPWEQFTGLKATFSFGDTVWDNSLSADDVDAMPDKIVVCQFCQFVAAYMTAATGEQVTSRAVRDRIKSAQ